MKPYNLILFVGVCVFALCGCKSSKVNVASGASKYERKPIVEVSEEQLNVEIAMIEAKMQQEINNSQEALAKYRIILKKYPDYAPAHYEVSQIMAGMNRLDSAIFHCQKAMAVDNGNKWYQLLMAELYGRRGLTGKEAEVWESLVKQNPNVIDYYYELSNTYISSNNISKAVEVLDRVEKKLGVTEPISMQKNKLWNAVGKYEKGIKEIEKLVDEFPEETKYCSMLAQAWMNLEQYEKAKKYYDRILAIDPYDGYTHLSLAQYYKAAGDEEATYQSLKKGFAYSDLTTQGKLQILSSIYPTEDFYGKDSKHAFELMDQIMSGSDDSLSFALFYGDVLMRQGKFAEAAYEFEKYLAVDSSKYELWEVILICESEIPDNENHMLSMAKRANKLFPLHSLPYYLQGFMSFQHDDFQKTIELLEKCVKLGFNNGYLEAECYGLLAESYHQIGEDEKSFSFFERYLKLHPNDYSTLNNFAYYLAQAGKELDKAEAMARTACNAQPTNATFLDTYAWVLYKNGKRNEAKVVMQKAFQYAEGEKETLQNHWRIINEE